MGERGFEEGQWYTNAEGSAVRVDLVRDGWVYFVAWYGHRDTGAPKRMPVGVFAEALDVAGMALDVAAGRDEGAKDG